MLCFAHPPRVFLFASFEGIFTRKRPWVGGALAALALAGALVAGEPVKGEFGKAIELAPFVVKGSPISVSIHARTKGDRRYAEKFADEVVDVAYETLGDFSSKGLVIVGAKGEPHPIHFFRQFLKMSQAGQLDPGLKDAVKEVEGMIKKMEAMLHVEGEGADKMGITFDTFVPALPMPLESAAASLYQLAWAEGFDPARVDKMLKSLTPAQLDRTDRVRYDWVFYLPPQSATGPVMDEMVTKSLKAEKIGLFKRAAIRSALVVFGPMVRKAVEGLRKGMLFRTILDAKSPWSDDDINELTKVYVGELMPDLKPGSGDERGRALAAIEKQKAANAEYAKDPFVKPARLASFDAVAYAIGEGEYTDNSTEITHRFIREGDCFHWKYRDQKPPRAFYPAGDRLLVNEEGNMTIRFLVDEAGAVTGVEERWVRRRKTVRRWNPEEMKQKPAPEKPKAGDDRRKKAGV